MDIQHRGGPHTAEAYKGIPVHAAPGVHQAVTDLLKARLPAGSRVADLGAGQGALSQRLADAGFDVTAIDVSSSDWMAAGVTCRVCNLDGDWQDVCALGPFDAIAAVEVIEHLENPRDFMRKIAALASSKPMLLAVTTPNPLDTFSAITVFTRGAFNWFSPAHYSGGGHISILPFWLIDKHLEYLGQAPCTWSFHSPFRHRNALGRVAYAGVAAARRLMSKGGSHNHFEGETAIGIVELQPRASGAVRPL